MEHSLQVGTFGDRSSLVRGCGLLEGVANGQLALEADR
jgi:hypothetical protein